MRRLTSVIGESGHSADLSLCPLMTQNRHFDFGSVARYAALLGLRTAQEPDGIYSAYFNPKVVVKVKATPASASTLWQVAAAAPLESSWNSLLGCWQGGR